jgi:hypothetical protein
VEHSTWSAALRALVTVKPVLHVPANLLARHCLHLRGFVKTASLQEADSHCILSNWGGKLGARWLAEEAGFVEAAPKPHRAMLSVKRGERMSKSVRPESAELGLQIDSKHFSIAQVNSWALLSIGRQLCIVYLKHFGVHPMSPQEMFEHVRILAPFVLFSAWFFVSSSAQVPDFFFQCSFVYNSADLLCFFCMPVSFVVFQRRMPKLASTRTLLFTSSILEFLFSAQFQLIPGPFQVVDDGFKWATQRRMDPQPLLLFPSLNSPLLLCAAFFRTVSTAL